MIENKACAVAANAGRVVEAAMVAHSERNNSQTADVLLFHHLERAPIQLRNGCGRGSRLKKVGDSHRKVLQAGFVSVDADAALPVVDKAHGAVRSLSL